MKLLFGFMETAFWIGFFIPIVFNIIFNLLNPRSGLEDYGDMESMLSALVLFGIYVILPGLFIYFTFFF